MAEIRCIGCDKVKTIGFPGFSPGDRLRGVIVCVCEEQNIFVLKDNVLTFLPGKRVPGNLSPTVASLMHSRAIQKSQRRERFLDQIESYS
jgi:hypothetical protein